MSNPQQPPEVPRPPASRRNSVGSVLMILLGIVLVLPGACSLYFLAAFAIVEPRNLLKFNDPIQGGVWVLWLVSFGLAFVGILLFRAASRR
jgi:hypothetical protein